MNYLKEHTMLLIKNNLTKTTSHNSKQAQFLVRGCSNAVVDKSQKLMPACETLS
jgi:hypothetical protein